MTIQARTAGSAPQIPRRPLIWALIAATLGGGATIVHPLAGVVVVALILAATLLSRVPIPRLGVAMTSVTAVAALAGPNLALPQVPSVFAFRVLIVAMLIGAVGYVLMGARIGGFGPIAIPVGLLASMALWAVFSTTWAEDRMAAGRWILFLSMMGSLAVAIPIAFGDRRRAVGFLRLMGITFAVIGAISFLEIALGVRLPTSRLAGRDLATGATSVFGNENNFATYLTISLPYLLALPLVFRDVRLRALGLFGAGLALVALLFTGSKANILAVGIIFITLLIYFGTDRRQRGRAVTAVVVAALSVGLVVPAMRGSGVVPLPERMVAKFDFTLLQAQVEQGTGSGAVRNSLLGDGLGLIRDSGGIGVGAGNADVKVRSLLEFPGVANMHNWWLEVGVNLGLVGLGIYILFYLHLATRQLRISRTSPDPLVRYLALAGAASLAGFVIGSLGPSTVIHFAPMWIMFGLGMLTIRLAANTTDRPPEEAPWNTHHSSP